MFKILYAITGFSVLTWAVLFGQTESQNPHGELKWKCEDCHTTESWTAIRQPLNFNHDETGFSLFGAHRSAECAGCHKELIFSNVGTACADCHTDHHRGRLGLACQNCHTPQDWQNRKDYLELHSRKGFPLTGIHAAVDCDACHRNLGDNEYVGTPLDCSGCHQDVFLTASNPDHKLAGFSSSCEACHTAAFGGWNKSTYVHPSGFPLTGAHRQIGCNSCHANSFAGTSVSCYDCHTANFNSVNDPNHVTNNFSHNCIICHSTTSWSPSTMNHAATGFPLTGKHATTPCASCHTNGYSGGTPTICSACHQAQYDATTNPVHTAAHFPTTCQTCHTTSGWTPSSWNHDAQFFPINSGAHQGKWTSCTDCHPNQSDFAVYQCAVPQCHPQSIVDPQHSQVDHYSYTSTACYTCHPTGSVGQ